LGVCVFIFFKKVLEMLVMKNAVKKVDSEGLALVLLGVTFAVFAAGAMAGTDTTFNGISTVLTNWMKGSLGQVFALGALAVGMAIAIVKQSLMAVAVGVGIAVAVYYGPGVLTSVVSMGV
jgi:conjugal transfer pilus assembly protein TraA